MRRPSVLLIGIAVVVMSIAAACSTGRQSSTSDGKIAVVAAESFWGSIARQLGGDRVSVTDIIDNPDTDPHDYEPTPSDGRAVAKSRYVIVNGLGYDTWASDLVSADTSDQRTVLDVGDLLGLHTGDNPHRWYFPENVTRVVDRITADLTSIDPVNGSYYAQKHDEFTGTALRPYRDLITLTRSTYAGTPVGASESIVEGMFQAAGLEMKTPPSFLDAISEGNDPDAPDKVTVDNLMKRHQISVFIYNGQNATPDVQRLVKEAHDNNIPVVTVTETPVPAGVTFQAWQTAQWQRLADALAQAKG